MFVRWTNARARVGYAAWISCLSVTGERAKRVFRAHRGVHGLYGNGARSTAGFGMHVNISGELAPRARGGGTHRFQSRQGAEGPVWRGMALAIPRSGHQNP